MNQGPDAHLRFVNVAVAGPLRRVFTYHLPPEVADLEPGQRVAVEFGKSRKVGFCLGPATDKPQVETKPILQVLDRRSFFTADLFKLCLWVAEYYFANPADVLSAALPPALKSTKASGLVWADIASASIPVEIRGRVEVGRKLPPKMLADVERAGVTLKALLEAGAVIEDWPSAEVEAATVVQGYRAQKPEEWPEFFRRRKISPEPFGDMRAKSVLKEEGWSDPTIRAAVKAGLLEAVVSDRNDDILNFVAGVPGLSELPLTDEQQRAVAELSGRLGEGFSGSLIHGVTGSGKTLVYCHLAREVLERGKSVLVLTPEIALSGATLAYFRGFFGSTVTVIHSAMTTRERLESWRGILNGKYRIVVGPRSAVFAPLQNPGLIIVDEEHDGSYKQDEPSPRFNGRDCAVMRAKMADIPVVLGSASPSVETYYNARQGRYRLIELRKRPAGATLPLVKLVDLKRERLHGDLPYLSWPLKKEVNLRLEKGEQVILFLNRRGYSPQIKCADCGHVPVCPECEIKLTYHKANRSLTCHYCGFTRSGYAVCEKCGGSSFLYPGVGTQKVEENVARLFPSARVLRFDSDTASGRRNAHDLLREFSEKNYNLLLGTQMVTKGLDLPGVSLVGVISADQGMDFPDFRAGEKTFARLLQVAGRSGRGSNPGEVLIQTSYPENEYIEAAARQDYHTFFDLELKSRKEFDYPPFCRLVRFVFSSKDEAGLSDVVIEFAERLRDQAEQGKLWMEMMGPAPCAMGLLRGNYRRHLIAKVRDIVRFGRMLTAWEGETARFGLPSRVKVTVDIDPDDMM